MKLLFTSSLPTDLNNKYLLVDTTTLINASRSEDFLELLVNIVEAGCSLVTIPSVVYEFTRGAQTLDQYNNQLEFIKTLGITVLTRTEESLDANTRVFILAYNKLTSKPNQKGASYTDSLLCAMAYKYVSRGTGLLLMTSNHNDIPNALFDREELITFDVNGDLRTEAIYKLSNTKLTRQLALLS